MMRIASAIVLAFCSMWLFCQPAFAERRIALVIGNSAYERVPQLPNPVNDATSMGEMFKRSGFDTVLLKLDVKASEMRRALRDFSDEARNADIAIIYFAGHGLEIQGTNYLVPTDAVLERDIDAYDEAVSLDRLLSVVEPARQLRLVILDACRDNPFSKSMKHAIVSRSVERGLAKVEPISPNTLVAFAAKAGSTADDGDSRHSPFTSALVKYLPQPGLDLRRAFGYVRDDVMKVTHNRQEPFIYGSLGGDDVPLVAAPKVAAPTAPIVDPNVATRDDYELTSQINVIAAWDSFLKKYPTGFYSDLARAQRDKLVAARDATSDQARLAAEKKAADEAKAAEAERQRLATQAAAEARNGAERQKALAEAKAAEDARLAAEKRAAETARLAAEKKAADEAKAAEAARLIAEKKAAEDARLAAQKKAAEEAKAAEAARLAAERKAAEDARIAEAARAKAAQDTKAAQAQAETNTKIAAVLPGDGRLGQQATTQMQHPTACSGAPQTVSLSPDAAGALSLPQECGLKPKDSFKECQNCPEMVVVPAGEFLMGSSQDEIDNDLAIANEAPQHKVAVKQSIAIGRFEITRDQYTAFVNASGYKGSGRCVTFEQNVPRERENRSYLDPGYVQAGNHPAVCVSWNDAQAYGDWLSKTTGKTYRLPSEAEYEYAARAGGTARYGFTDDPANLCRFVNGADQTAKTAGLPPTAPYMACSDGFPFTAPAGSFAPNAFGLHDLIGNVWEWTADCYVDNYRSAASDSAPRNETGCTAHAVRGGDWFSTAASLRPAVRAKASPDAHNDDIGFRVARVLLH
jgi:formylglycine-generating enzyme required for sulfatase activity